MTLWDRLCCVGYGINARWDALGHFFRGHRIHWRDHIDLWLGCFGDIWCEGCPDIDGGDLVFWCRNHDWALKIAQAVCEAVGHPGWSHPLQYDKPKLDELWCDRCVKSWPVRGGLPNGVGA